MFKLYGAILAAALLAAGCGGGDGVTGGGAGAGTQTGILTDAPIQGVQYTTSSGVTGTTDAQGRYSYNPGDTVTFRLGAVTLGQVPATGVVTPIQLAGGSDTKLNNLLVVLQSLDADADPGTGIVIPSTATSALTVTFDLSVPLTASATDAITNAQAAAGVPGGIKTEQEAQAHFVSQARTLLASNVWVARDANGKPESVVYANGAGKYLLGDFGAADSSGAPGYETGTITPNGVDADGFSFSTSILVETNGEWGFSGLGTDARFAVDGDKLTVKTADDTGTLLKMENDPSGLVGAWRFAATSATRSPATNGLFLFFSNGYFALVDAVGELESSDVPPEERCGVGGIELGQYTRNAGTGVVTPVQPALLNTNGCVGLYEMGEPGSHPTTHYFTLSSDGKTAVWRGVDDGGEWTVDLVRVSK